MFTKIKLFGFKDVHNFIMTELLSEVLKILGEGFVFEYESVYYIIKNDILYFYFTVNRDYGDKNIVIFNGIKLNILIKPDWKKILIEEEAIREKNRIYQLNRKKEIEEREKEEKEILEYKRLIKKYGDLEEDN
jgi:hypothetical protein